MESMFIILSSDPFAHIRSGLASVLLGALGLAGMVSLVIVVVNIIQGDRDAAKKASVWLISLLVGFTLLSVIRNL